MLRWLTMLLVLVHSLAWAQESDPTPLELQARRAALRAAAHRLIQTETTRARIVKDDGVWLRVCGLAPGDLGLPASVAGHEVCLIRRWAGDQKVLRQVTLDGRTVGVLRRWDTRGVLVDESRYDLQGRRHGVTVSGGHTSEWDHGLLLSVDGVPSTSEVTP